MAQTSSNRRVSTTTPGGAHASSQGEARARPWGEGVGAEVRSAVEGSGGGNCFSLDGTLAPLTPAHTSPVDSDRPDLAERTLETGRKHKRDVRRQRAYPPLLDPRETTSARICSVVGVEQATTSRCIGISSAHGS
jgi:hypothetical protein